MEWKGELSFCGLFKALSAFQHKPFWFFFLFLYCCFFHRLLVCYCLIFLPTAIRKIYLYACTYSCILLVVYQFLLEIGFRWYLNNSLWRCILLKIFSINEYNNLHCGLRKHLLRLPDPTKAKLLICTVWDGIVLMEVHIGCAVVTLEIERIFHNEPSFRCRSRSVAEQGKGVCYWIVMLNVLLLWWNMFQIPLWNPLSMQ